MDRRSFFSEFSRSLLSSVASSVEAVRSVLPSLDLEYVDPTSATWIRPPGALPEPQFRSRCTQCAECVKACPYDSIRRLGPEFGPDAGTPAIIVDESPCFMCDDMPCIPVCEPGALVPMARDQVKMGLAILDKPACYVSQGQRCDYCVVRCPVGKSAISFDENKIPVIDDVGCVGCGVCSYICPADAISLTPNSYLTKGSTP